MSEQHQSNENAMRKQMIPHQMFGRRKIFTSVDRITADNVANVVEQAYLTHLLNRDEINYLWEYYKGRQPSLWRKREYKDWLTSHIVENRANEIVSFKVGYTAGKPITYVSSVPGNEVSRSVAKLNDAMRIIGKHTKDKELIEGEFAAPNKEKGRILLVREQVENQAEAERLAKKKLREANKEEMTGEFTTVGNHNVAAGQVIELKNFGKFDGNYLVTKVNHEIREDYTTKIYVRRCLDGY